MSNRIKSLFVLILVVCISACESGGESPTSGLEGTWSVQEFTAEVAVVISVGGIEINSTSSIVGSDLDYNLTFTETGFTTSGSYTVTNDYDLAGFMQTLTSTLSNVSGSGTYTSTNTELTLSNSFFNIEVNGMPLEGSGEAQTIAYEINSNGELIFSQSETITTTDSGATSTATTEAFSRWTRN